MKRIFLLLILALNINLCLGTEEINLYKKCLDTIPDGNDGDMNNCQYEEIDRIKDRIENKIKLAREGNNYFNKGAPIENLNEKFYNQQVDFIDDRCNVYRLYDGTMYTLFKLNCKIEELNLLDKFISKYVEGTTIGYGNFD